MHWHCLCDLWLGWWRNAVCSFWLHRKPVGISCPRWWRHKKIEKIEFKLRETEQWVTELFTTIPKYFRGICVLIRTVSTQNSTPGCWNCWGFCLELLVQVAVCGWEKGCQCLFGFFVFPAVKNRGLGWLLHLFSLQGLTAVSTQPHVSLTWLHPFSHWALCRWFC